jgi:endonuclease/exonuclease/phosphatase family metal-dependent hydrolase
MKSPYKLLLLALAALMLVPATAPAATKKKNAKTVDVTLMSRNLYLGADIITLATAQNQQEFEQKAASLFQTVQQTDFAARAALLADEIKANKPDLIGLQEVALWRRGADGVKDGSTTPATTVVYDWLASLDAELKKRGLNYKVAKFQDEFDFEGPTSQGYDIRFTQRDAILVRVGKDVKVKNSRSGNFKAGLQVPLNSIGATANVKRGWVSTDATVKGAPFRFVDSHLEAYSEAIGTEQAKELVAKRGPANYKGQTVLVGDMNSALNTDNSDPIDALIKFGFGDTFFQKTRKNTPTCCQAENLLNQASELKTRIDFVLAKPTVKIARSVIVGNNPGIRTSAGLWPSDHAGVVSKLKLPVKK